LSKTVRLSKDRYSLEGDVDAIAGLFERSRRTVCLTGAGISVESGIPDFRSEGGLWSKFNPMEYATLSCFRDDHDKAWKLYRALGATLCGKKPNPAHQALARLEQRGKLSCVITQNVDSLHQEAGSRNVLEVHGDHRRLQCLSCDHLEPFKPEHLEEGPVPRCTACGDPLKPNVVLFEELPRELERIFEILGECDLMLVIGTSANVTPAAHFPSTVLYNGGNLIEFNLEPTMLTASGLGPEGVFVAGPVGSTLPLVADLVTGKVEGDEQ